MHQKSLLPSAWEIPEAIRIRLGDEPGRQRMMQADGHLLLILHAPPHPNDDCRQGRFFWRQPDGKWSAAGGHAGPTALDALLDEYKAEIEKIEETDENAKSAQDYFEIMDRITPLVRAIGHVHTTLSEARKAFPEDRRLIVARDRAYRLHRQIEILHANVSSGLDVAIALRAEQQAESSRQMAIAAHRLNLLVAFFFPVATLLAIFSSNLNSDFVEWYDSHVPWPLLGILLAGLLLGAILTALLVRTPPGGQ